MEAPDTSVRVESRQTPRLKAKLEVTLTTDTSILTHDLTHGAEHFPLDLLGHTDNVSEAGLAFVVPSLPVDEEFCRDGEKTLRIGLALPTGRVTLEASPVHCEPLNSSDPGQGYLMGVRIRQMDERDHERYLQYLRTARRDEQ
jgi:hypothetical protein